ncbi:MAG: hypothetical protein ABIG63_12865 [Chloroflexota bacterium]
MSLEKVEELMDMLTDNCLPEGMRIKHQPQLSRKQAFSIVWFLQEHMGVLPDNIEMCGICGNLFDADSGGFVVDGTDVPDDWQENIGVTKEILQQNDGAKFCSQQCEYEFWQNVAKMLDDELTATKEAHLCAKLETTTKT